MKTRFLPGSLFHRLYEYALSSAYPHALRDENMIQQSNEIQGYIYTYKL